MFFTTKRKVNIFLFIKIFCVNKKEFQIKSKLSIDMWIYFSVVIPPIPTTLDDHHFAPRTASEFYYLSVCLFCFSDDVFKKKTVVTVKARRWKVLQP